MIEASGLIRLSGRTTDGKDMWAGVWDFYSTHGLPVDIIMEMAVSRNAIPDWLDFYDRAIETKANPRNVRAKIREMAEVVSNEFADGVMFRLEKHRPSQSGNTP